METPLLNEQPQQGEVVGHCGHLGPNKPAQRVHATMFEEPTQLHGANVVVTILWAFECDDCYVKREGECPTVRGFMLWPESEPIVRESVSH